MKKQMTAQNQQSRTQKEIFCMKSGKKSQNIEDAQDSLEAKQIDLLSLSSHTKYPSYILHNF